MSPWLVAAGAGLGFALIQYAWRGTHRGPLGLLAAAMRFLAATLVVALLLDAPTGPPRSVSSWAALDVSESMRRGDGSLWRAAIDSLRAARAESVLVFGDSARSGSATDSARDVRSELRPVADRALASGHPVSVITDGELSDPDAATSLPAGSRLIVLPRGQERDVAVSTLEVPRAVVSGDTVATRLNLVAGSAGSGPGTATLLLDGREVGRASFDALPPYGSRSIESRVRIEGTPGPATLQAVVSSAGDVVARNDTFTVSLDRSRSASAVFVSTSPDFDSRAALGLLRGALAMPARGFLRIAPGVWRVEGSLSPVAESEVRAALADAPIAIIHGDSMAFGAPQSATVAPYALLIPTTDTTGEWYVTATPPSPLLPAYTGIAWDSLPPVITGGEEPRGAWAAMHVSEGRAGTPRVLVAGNDAPRRSVTIAGSGFWRWQFRGGKSAEAFAAFWGGIFDWLAGERADRRAAIPDAAAFRAGDRIRWRRGSAADSVATVTLRKRNAPSRSDSLILRFPAGATVVETPPMEAGQYDIFVRGGRSILAVNASAEWLPRQVRAKAGLVRGGASAGAQPRLRDYAWIYALVIAALCAEWLARRKIGLR